KSGVADFARDLAGLGWEIVASGGTAAHLQEHGIEVTPVESLTGFGELLGHRVVTLHPAVHGGILARRDLASDLADLEAHGIEPFDLVCVNLYPFSREPSVELIDIGGPSLIRGAAKNYEHVAPVSNPTQYAGVLEEIEGDGSLSLETRRRLAADAFAMTAAYEQSIAHWFGGRIELAYGENPHQQAWFVGAPEAIGEQLHGKQLSYNNLNDLSAARG